MQKQWGKQPVGKHVYRSLEDDCLIRVSFCLFFCGVTCRTCKGNFDEVLPGSFNAGVDTETLQQIVADAEVMEDIERIGTIAEVSENPKSRAAGSFPPVQNT